MILWRGLDRKSCQILSVLYLLYVPYCHSLKKKMSVRNVSWHFEQNDVIFSNSSFVFVEERHQLGVNSKPLVLFLMNGIGLMFKLKVSK